MNEAISTLTALAPAAVAQLSASDASPLVWWLVGLAAAAAIVNQVVLAIRNLSGKSVRDRDAVSPEQCAARHASLDSRLDVRFRDIERALIERDNALRAVLSQDVRGVHQRVDEVLGAVSEVRGELKRIGKGSPR